MEIPEIKTPLRASVMLLWKVSLPLFKSPKLELSAVFEVGRSGWLIRFFFLFFSRMGLSLEGTDSGTDTSRGDFASKTH